MKLVQQGKNNERYIRLFWIWSYFSKDFFWTGFLKRLEKIIERVKNHECSVAFGNGEGILIEKRGEGNREWKNDFSNSFSAMLSLHLEWQRIGFQGTDKTGPASIIV